MNTQELQNNEIREGIVMKKLQDEGMSSLILKEKGNENDSLSTKVPIYEEEAIFTKIIGKEEMENIKKIQKSKNQTNILFKLREGEKRIVSDSYFIENNFKSISEARINFAEKFKIKEKLNIQSAGDEKIISEKFLQKSKSEAEVSKLIREARKEEININTKTFKEEFKNFQANLIGKEDWESYRKIIKSASQSSIKFTGKEFEEEKQICSIFIEQKQKDFEEFEIKIKDTTKINEKINTKLAEDYKIETQIILEHPNNEEEAILNFEDKIKEKTFLSLIQNKTEIPANFIARGEEAAGISSLILHASGKEKNNYEVNDLVSSEIERIDDTLIGLTSKEKDFEEINTKLEEKTEEKVELKSKASIEDKRIIETTITGREEREDVNKIIKSASQFSIKFIGREFSEERAISSISFDQKPKDFEEFEIKIKEKRQLEEKIRTKSAGDFKIEGQMIFDKLDKQEKADLKLKEKLQEKALLSSKASTYEEKEFSANSIGKEEWENAKKLQKSASLSSVIFKVRELVETRSGSAISINQRSEDSEEFEIRLQEKRQLQEKINTKAVGDFKIKNEIILEKLNCEEKADKNLKEKLKEKTSLSSKASIKELKEFSANFVGKEEWESTRKIQKSKSLSSVTLKLKEFIESRASSVLFIEKPKEYLEESEIKLKEKYKIKEKLNTKEMGDLKIGQNIYFEQKSKPEIIEFTQKEKIKERSLLNTEEKETFGDVKIEEERFLQKSKSKLEVTKLIKSTSQISTKLNIKEFKEDIINSIISIGKEPINWKEFEIKVKDTTKINEKINTKAAENCKIEDKIILEKPNDEEKTSLDLKEKLKGKAILSSKASIYEEKYFSANLLEKEKLEGTGKIIKSASQSSVISKIKEFGETRFDSSISFDQRPKIWGEFEIEIKERRKLEEKINTKSVGDLRIENQVALEHPNFEEKTDLNLSEKLQEKIFLSFKASIHEKKNFTANLIGKEEWESSKKIIKSASHSSIKFKGREFSEENSGSFLSLEKSSKVSEDTEINLKEKRQIQEKFKGKSSRDAKIEKNIFLDISTKSESQIDKIIKLKNKEEIKLKSKESSLNSKILFTNFVCNKQNKYSINKLEKSKNQNFANLKIKEVGQKSLKFVVCIENKIKEGEEVEILIKEKRNLKENKNCLAASDLNIQRILEIKMPKIEKEYSYYLNELIKENIFFKSKAVAKEKSEEIQTILSKKEEQEHVKGLLKSKSQTNISFKSREMSEEGLNSNIYIENELKDKNGIEVIYSDMNKIQEKLNTQSAGDEKIISEKSLQKSKSEAKVFKLVKEQRKEEININTKTFKEEFKNFQANLIGKEDWESYRKIIKSASQSSVIAKIKEFGETRFYSSIYFDQRPKNWGEFEIEIKEKRKLEEKINTKAIGDLKIESRIALEHPNFEGITDLNLKEKLQEKTFLSSKASIHEKKDFTANLIGKEEWESSKKIIKSASQSSIKFKGREFSHERASSVISFYRRNENSKRKSAQKQLGISKHKGK
ncbi:unnamed protein product [Meloidogyne enterolobii]|uniref:Uncharacterized protein n=1 Tax=Meloidogyne enterolobii TaxID=390850 RepID=A0ACB0YFR8_MELEN